jgi:hypothetical protein
MKQFQPLIVAYLVSWSTDPVFAEIANNFDSANFDYNGSYDFSNSSAAEFRYGYTHPIEMNKSYTAEFRQPCMGNRRG